MKFLYLPPVIDKFSNLEASLSYDYAWFACFLLTETTDLSYSRAEMQTRGSDQQVPTISQLLLKFGRFTGAGFGPSYRLNSRKPLLRTEVKVKMTLTLARRRSRWSFTSSN